jgi:hypothetical protein
VLQQMRRNDLQFSIKAFIFLTFVFFLQDSIHAHVEQPKDQSSIGIDEKLG